MSIYSPILHVSFWFFFYRESDGWVVYVHNRIPPPLLGIAGVPHRQEEREEEEEIPPASPATVAAALVVDGTKLVRDPIRSQSASFRLLYRGSKEKRDRRRWSPKSPAQTPKYKRKEKQNTPVESSFSRKVLPPSLPLFFPHNPPSENQKKVNRSPHPPLPSLIIHAERRKSTFCGDSRVAAVADEIIETATPILRTKIIKPERRTERHFNQTSTASERRRRRRRCGCFC